MTHFPRLAFLPKVESKVLRDECRHMPCTLRIASFLGIPCAPQETVVGAHVTSFGKGMGTKETDLALAAACVTCHDLADMRDDRWHILADRYGAAVEARIRGGILETLSMQLFAGNITVKGAKIR